MLNSVIQTMSVGLFPEYSGIEQHCFKSNIISTFIANYILNNDLMLLIGSWKRTLIAQSGICLTNFFLP
jgi:hypothetical protein